MKKYATQVRYPLNIVFAMLLAILAAPLTAWAADASWHHESASYHVYLGVVPAGLIKANPVLVDGNKTLHIGDNTSDSSEHMLVSVFRKPNNERVVNATVIARVGAKKWLGGIKVEKPLEKMLTSGVVTYGNYFSIPKKGKYEIAVRISEPNKDQTESVTFVYNKY